MRKELQLERRRLVVCCTNEGGLGFVMPAQAGIQGDSALAFSYTSWIPAFAGMTRSPVAHHFHCGALFVIIALCLVALFGPAAFALEAPSSLEAFDMPSDSGGSVGLRWAASPFDEANAGYRITFSDRPDGTFTQLAEFPANTHYETEVTSPWWAWGEKRQDRHFFQVKSAGDGQLANDRVYFFKVALVRGQESTESPVVAAAPRANFFNWTKLNNLLLMLIFGVTVIVSIHRARTNPNIFLRRIPGLDAVDEAVGRATEMGRPVLYLTGSGELGGGGDPSSLATIAATVILGEVAKRVASYGADIKIPHRAPIVMAICQEMVRESYLAAGRPDAYKEDANFFITRDQFAYTAAVDGMMLREKPAANFFMGYYYAESLLLAETGAATGAIQIAGTDAEHQLPFFVTTCDYTLIGEELYAASAYLSREPALVGTLRAQDIGKAVLLTVMVLGAVLLTIGEIVGAPMFRPLFQLFSDFK